MQQCLVLSFHLTVLIGIELPGSCLHTLVISQYPNRFPSAAFRIFVEWCTQCSFWGVDFRRARSQEFFIQISVFSVNFTDYQCSNV